MKKLHIELIGIACVILDMAVFAKFGPSNVFELAIGVNMAAILTVCYLEEKKRK